MTTTKFTEEQQEKALEILTDKGDLDIMPVEKFMTAYKPYEVARIVKMANLNLDSEYIRVGAYYLDVRDGEYHSDTHESNDEYALLSDGEIEEALDELQ